MSESISPELEKVARQLHSALRFAASRSAITADDERSILELWDRGTKALQPSPAGLVAPEAIEALEKCLITFREYEASHHAKWEAMPDALVGKQQLEEANNRFRKAERNREMAELCEAALSLHSRVGGAGDWEELERLRELTSCSVTVGGGLEVYGTIEAVGRVQIYIMLDSTHPVEQEDVRRYLARHLQIAEAKLASRPPPAMRDKVLEEALRPFAKYAEQGGVEGWNDAELPPNVKDFVNLGCFRRASAALKSAESGR